MNWLGFLIPSFVILLPLLALLLPGRRAVTAPVSARLSALTLYRHQLRDLDRDRENSLLGDDEKARAELEIQRRILAADRLAEAELTAQPHQKLRFALLLVALPCFGFALYLTNGHPSLPAQPHRATTLAVPPAMQALFEKLARQVANMTPDDPDYVRQSVLLGQVDEALNRPADALRAIVRRCQPTSYPNWLCRSPSFRPSRTAISRPTASLCIARLSTRRPPMRLAPSC